MVDLVTALGLVLVIEGLIYGAFPTLGKKLGEMLLVTPEESLRMIGLATAVVGIGIVWLARSFI